MDLSVPPGPIVGLVGESGSGKSTLASAAVGMVPLEGGAHPVRWITAPVHGPAAVADGLPGPVLIARSADDHRRIHRGGAAAGHEPDRAQIRGRASPRARPPRPHALTAYPGHLSGGQRQRVAPARALAGRPAVLIVDEITSALDVSIQGAALNLVRELQRGLGLSILFISHDLAVVRYVASHVAVMYQGRIVEFGSAAGVLADPQHSYTRDLLAAIPGTPNAPEEAGMVGLLEAVDPHHPPPGCRYHARCPVGPIVRLDRDECRTVEPTTDHRHMAACHFAAPADPVAAEDGGTP